MKTQTCGLKTSDKPEIHLKLTECLDSTEFSINMY